MCFLLSAYIKENKSVKLNDNEGIDFIIKIVIKHHQKQLSYDCMHKSLLELNI